MTQRAVAGLPSTLRFDCTMCGKCCHDLRLPLAIDEAARWIDAGGVVEILADALPAGSDADYGPSSSSYRQAAAIPAYSGTVAIDVAITLVATFAGPCPFLKPDMSCGNYDARPRVCRVYPAEANPFRRLDPAAKACPEEAWAGTQPLLLRDDRVVPEGVRQAIRGVRIAGVHDRKSKLHLTRRLGVNSAALANEGLAVHRPASSLLRAALTYVLSNDAPDTQGGQWWIATNRRSTLVMLEEAGCDGVVAGDDYIGFFPSDSFAH